MLCVFSRRTTLKLLNMKGFEQQEVGLPQLPWLPVCSGTPNLCSALGSGQCLVPLGPALHSFTTNWNTLRHARVCFRAMHRKERAGRPNSIHLLERRVVSLMPPSRPSSTFASPLQNGKTVTVCSQGQFKVLFLTFTALKMAWDLSPWRADSPPYEIN